MRTFGNERILNQLHSQQYFVLASINKIKLLYESKRPCFKVEVYYFQVEM